MFSDCLIGSLLGPKSYINTLGQYAHFQSNSKHTDTGG